MPHIWRMFSGLLLGALVACSSSPTEEPVPSAVLVELDAYSGMPNPSWILSQEQARALEERLTDLPVAEGATPPEGGLGYRGFWVENRGEGRIPARVYISQGLVVVPSQGIVTLPTGQVTSLLYRDIHGAEAWLQDQARRQGHADTFR